MRGSRRQTNDIRCTPGASADLAARLHPHARGPILDATDEPAAFEPEADPAFWAMIEERRRQPTMSRAELDDYLRERDRERAAAAPPDPAP